MATDRYDVVIVGAGFAGTLVAVQLTRVAPSFRVLLAERRNSHGRGVAYSTDSDRHLLNVPAGKMSAFADEPDHFWSWAKQSIPNARRDDFLPRKLFGSYVREILAAAEESN